MITYRDEEVATDHPLRFVLGDLPPHAVERIVLKPLSEDAVLALADGALPDLFSESGGNPFYVTEVLGTRDAKLPASIVDAVHARVGRVSAPALDLVELVSVVPGRTERSVIEALVPDWSPSADEAEQRGVLVLTPAHLAFRHELARRAVEQALTATRRVEFNQRILTERILEGGDRSRIVHHAVEAGDAAAILEHAPIAAAEARAVASHREAYGYYLTLEPFYGRLGARERAELLQGWSDSASVVNYLPQSIVRIDEAIAIWRSLGDPIGLGGALRWRSRVAWLAGDRSSAEAHADEAVAVLEPGGANAELAYAYSAQSQLAMLAEQFDHAIERAELAIEAAEALGEERILAHATVNLGSALALAHYPRETETLRGAIELATRIGFYDEMVRGNINLSWSTMLARDLPTAERLAGHTITLCDESDLAAFGHYARGTLAMVRMLRGDFFGAEDIVRPILVLPDLWTTSEIVLRTVPGTIQARRGDPAADANLAAAWEMAVTARELQRTGQVALARAEHAWITGDHASVAPIAAKHLEESRRVGANWMAGDLVL